MSAESKPKDCQSNKCLCTKDSVSHGPHGLGRRIVVAFDGTENQFGPESSYVVEVYSRIAESADQLSYYASGIGTFVKPSSFARCTRKRMKNKWEAMSGRNFTSNILSGYRFLSDEYKTGDQIFLLGFSRGAYQARVLAAMIRKIGLLRTGNNEQIPFAFEVYKDPKTSIETQIDSARPERGTTTVANEFRKAFCCEVNVHFVGVWESVSSVGMFRDKYYPGAALVDNICFFRHALALDERRVKFLPEYAVAKKEWFLPGEFGRPRCKEVWFRGAHSDVGGGNANTITTDNGAIPSRWMAYEASLAGLKMNPFLDNIKVEDLGPIFCKDSMRLPYSPLEYLCLIRWEDHSESRLPLLTDKGEHPLRRFSRVWHRKRPRQIYDYQKLHPSVRLQTQGFPETPFAYLPDSWIDRPGGQCGWAEVIEPLQINEKNMMREATDGSGGSETVLLPSSPEEGGCGTGIFDIQSDFIF